MKLHEARPQAIQIYLIKEKFHWVINGPEGILGCRVVDEIAQGFVTTAFNEFVMNDNFCINCRLKYAKIKKIKLQWSSKLSRHEVVYE